MIQLADYTSPLKARMIELLLRVDVYRDGGVIHRNRVTDPRWEWLRANRGAFDVDHQDSGIKIVANNRSDWIGWLELATIPTAAPSTRRCSARRSPRRDADRIHRRHGGLGRASGPLAQAARQS
jgi:hypothetical protein